MRVRRMVVSSFAAWALMGCSEAGLQPAGSICVRSTQCEPGLACVGGMCTSDLSGLEGGVVPSMDAGMVMIDAGPPMDAGPPVDSGPPRDSGPGMDSGPPPVDSGPPPVDSGPPPVDSGPPPVDSGPPPVDSGPPPIDAG